MIDKRDKAGAREREIEKERRREKRGEKARRETGGRGRPTEIMWFFFCL